MSRHFVRTGENLLEKVFDHLTSKQLKALKIKTNIQRTDSFLAASNIRNYTRLQLLIELVLRIFRILTQADKVCFKNRFSYYLGKTSGQHIYQLEAVDLPHELEKIARLYTWINQVIKPDYSEHEIIHTFARVFTEHFTLVKDKIQIKNNDELSSKCLQSPDLSGGQTGDLDATFRSKNKTQSRGQSINVVETVHPENGINLINDVSVQPNNKDDSCILDERLDQLQEKTPDLDELHFDGGYGSEPVDHHLPVKNSSDFLNFDEA